MDEFLGVNLTSAIEYFKVAVYFSAFFGVIYACVNRTIQSRNSVKAWLLTVNGVVALTIAWFFIGSWFIQEFQASSKSSSSSSIISLNDVLRWVEGADLFERAYVLVTFDVRGWIWSQQLLFLSITVSVIMWSEGSMRVSRGPGQERLTMSVGQGGKRVNNKNGNGTTFLSAWIFLILGFLGAMSAGFSLFLSHMTFVPRLGKEGRMRVGSH